MSCVCVMTLFIRPGVLWHSKIQSLKSIIYYRTSTANPTSCVVIIAFPIDYIDNDHFLWTYIALGKRIYITGNPKCQIYYKSVGSFIRSFILKFCQIILKF